MIFTTKNATLKIYQCYNKNRNSVKKTIFLAFDVLWQSCDLISKSCKFVKFTISLFFTHNLKKQKINCFEILILYLTTKKTKICICFKPAISQKSQFHDEKLWIFSSWFCNRNLWFDVRRLWFFEISWKLLQNPQFYYKKWNIILKVNNIIIIIFKRRNFSTEV